MATGKFLPVISGELSDKSLVFIQSAFSTWYEIQSVTYLIFVYDDIYYLMEHDILRQNWLIGVNQNCYPHFPNVPYVPYDLVLHQVFASFWLHILPKSYQKPIRAHTGLKQKFTRTRSFMRILFQGLSKPPLFPSLHVFLSTNSTFTNRFGHSLSTT